MKIDKSRYNTQVDILTAEGSSDLWIKLIPDTIHCEKGISTDQEHKIIRKNRIAFSGTVDEFPEVFKGYTVLVEIVGHEKVPLYSDIDEDHVGIGNIVWFEKKTLYLRADVTVDLIDYLQNLVQSECKDRASIIASVIGLESIEFKNNELSKGVLVDSLKVIFKGQ